MVIDDREQYRRYTMIRDCVNQTKCKRLPLSEVRKRLDHRLTFVIELTNLTEEEIYFSIDYCEEHYPYVK